MILGPDKCNEPGSAWIKGDGHPHAWLQGPLTCDEAHIDWHGVRLRNTAAEPPSPTLYLMRLDEAFTSWQCHCRSTGCLLSISYAATKLCSCRVRAQTGKPKAGGSKSSQHLPSQCSCSGQAAAAICGKPGRDCLEPRTGNSTEQYAAPRPVSKMLSSIVVMWLHL